MDELQCIVEAMLPTIEANLNAAPSIFKLWFGDFVLMSLDEKEAVFSTPTDLRKRILTTKYLPLISSSLAEIIGFEVEIKIISKEELQAKANESDPLDFIPTKEEALEEMKKTVDNVKKVKKNAAEIQEKTSETAEKIQKKAEEKIESWY